MSAAPRAVSVGRHDARPVGGRLERVVRLARLESAPATLAFAVVGAATTAEAGLTRILAAAAVGVAFHVFAFVSNDVIDLPIDRTDERRARSPLVTGAVAPQWALMLALTQLPVSLAVLITSGGAAGVGLLAAAAAGLMLYNLAGKLLRVPFLADVGQGVGFAFLVLATAAVGDTTAATWWAMTWVVVFVALTNGIHGGLRDAENDRVAGARTTALLLGARASPDGGLWVPRRVMVWGVALQVAVLALLVAPLAAGALRPTHAWQHGIAGGALLLGVASAAALVLAYGSRRDVRRAMAWGAWNLFLALAAFVALYLSQLPPVPAAAAVAAFLAPWLLFDRAVRRTPFAVPRNHGGTRRAAPAVTVRLRGLWQMARPGNPASAAVLVAAGGVAAGGPPERFAAAMSAVALVVVAANIFNDRCDQPADRVNRPDRPLPAGQVLDVDADRAVLAAGVTAVVVAVPLGATAGMITAVLLVVALSYSLVWRRHGVLGPLVVGLLFAAAVPAGGVFVSGAVGDRHWLAAALVTTFVFARETLKCVPDEAGDRAAGVGTVAVRLGSSRAVMLFRTASGLFLAALLLPLLVGAAGPDYLAAAVLCGAAPTVAALWQVRGRADGPAVGAALDMTGRVFGLGLVPVVLLVA